MTSHYAQAAAVSEEKVDSEVTTSEAVISSESLDGGGMGQGEEDGAECKLHVNISVYCLVYFLF